MQHPYLDPDLRRGDEGEAVRGLPHSDVIPVQTDVVPAHANVIPAQAGIQIHLPVAQQRHKGEANAVARPSPLWGRVLRSVGHRARQPSQRPARRSLARSALIGALLAASALAVPRAAAAAEAVRIGLAVPLAGREAALGLAMEKALKAAVAAADAAGGVAGRPLALMVEDDGCAAASGEGAARRLAAAGAALVIGHPCASAATAAVPVYAAAGVLLIAVGARHPDVTDRDRGAPVLRLAGRDDRQGESAAAWLIAHAPERRIALVHDRTAYARAVVDRALAVLKAAGIEPAALLPLVAGRHDYADAVLKLDASRAEAVLFAGFPPEASLIVYGMEKRGLDAPVLGIDTLATAGFAEFAAKASLGVYVLLAANTAADLAAESAAEARAREAEGALEVWLAAARGAGSLEGQALNAALRGGPPVATRALGEVRFDSNGDLVAHAFAAASARAGRWVREK